MIFRTLCLVLGLILIDRTALAGCSDPPAPGVDWSDCVKIGLSMNGANFSNANLRGLLLSGSVMTNTSFKGADLTDTRFASTDLTGSDFSGANLLRTTFTAVQLSSTVFHNAKMDVVTATNVDATDADFSGAEVSDAMEFMMKFCRTIMPDGSIRSGACDEKNGASD
jgi:uncharacterized protein YjbI with pentapeptide repeats